MIKWTLDIVGKGRYERHKRVYIENFGYSYKTDELIITKENGETEVIDLTRYKAQLTTYDETEVQN